MSADEEWHHGRVTARLVEGCEIRTRGLAGKDIELAIPYGRRGDELAISATSADYLLAGGSVYATGTRSCDRGAWPVIRARAEAALAEIEARGLLTADQRARLARVIGTLP